MQSFPTDFFPLSTVIFRPLPCFGSDFPLYSVSTLSSGQRKTATQGPRLNWAVKVLLIVLSVMYSTDYCSPTVMALGFGRFVPLCCRPLPLLKSSGGERKNCCWRICVTFTWYTFCISIIQALAVRFMEVLKIMIWLSRLARRTCEPMTGAPSNFVQIPGSRTTCCLLSVVQIHHCLQGTGSRTTCSNTDTVMYYLHPCPLQDEWMHPLEPRRS